MRILGIDPGLGKCGFAVLDTVPFGLPEPVGPDWCGVITTKEGAPIPGRLVELERDMQALLEQYDPQVLAIEEFLVNPRLAHNNPMVLQARGVVLLACSRRGMTIREYKPSAVKLAIAGDGRADKRAMQEAVMERLGLETIIRPDDANDAAAIAFLEALMRQGGDQ